MYDVNKFPEKYYFGILLMFKPWRNLAGLKAGQNTYTEAFNILKDNIREGINYGELQTEFVNTIDKAFEMIESKISEIEEKDNEVV